MTNDPQLKREIRRLKRKWPHVLAVLTCPLWFPFACCICVPVLFHLRHEFSDLTPRRLWQRKKQERKERKMNDQLMKEIPCPLPDVRERALSIGSSTDGAIGEVEVSDQLQSVFFARLPREVREIIYQYYLGGDDGTCKHIFRRTDNRLGCCSCAENAPHHQAMPLAWGYDGVSRTGAWVKSEGTRIRSSSTSIAFLKTCRRVYSESIPFLYSDNKFCFHDEVSYHYFSKLRHTVPHHFHSISNIQLPWITPLSATETAGNHHVSGFINKEVATAQVFGVLTYVPIPKALREIRFLIAEDESQRCPIWGSGRMSSEYAVQIHEIERISRVRGYRVFVDGEEAMTALTQA